MPDVRELLERGAVANPGLPDVDELWRRAAVVRRRRLAAGSSVVAALVALTVVLGSWTGTLTRGEQPPAPAAPPATALPGVGSALAAGTTYTAEAFDLDYAFTVPGDGWALVAAEPGWVSLRRADLRVNLQRWSAVVDPGADPVRAGDELPLPGDLAQWLGRSPGVRVRTRGSEVVAGEAWARLDLTVSPLRRTPTECRGRPCRLLAVAGSEPVEVYADEQATVRIASRGAGPVVLLAAHRVVDEGSLPLAELVESLRRRTP